MQLPEDVGLSPSSDRKPKYPKFDFFGNLPPPSAKSWSKIPIIHPKLAQNSLQNPNQITRPPNKSWVHTDYATSLQKINSCQSPATQWQPIFYHCRALRLCLGVFYLCWAWFRCLVIRSRGTCNASRPDITTKITKTQIEECLHWRFHFCSSASFCWLKKLRDGNLYHLHYSDIWYSIQSLPHIQLCSKSRFRHFVICNYTINIKINNKHSSANSQ